jgi:AraC-like DNA-binding protein
LQDGDLRISEIAFAVGFQSLSQFNRVFKKLSEGSPTQYRTATAKRRPRR